MIGQSTVYGRSSWQGVERSASLFFPRTLLAASCAKSAVLGAVSIALSPSMTFQSDDRHDLAGEWESVEALWLG